MKTATHLALLAAGAFGLALAGFPAAAQDYDDDAAYSDNDANYDEDTYTDDEAIVVTAPRLPPADARGLPQRVSLSQEVSFGDLDLRTVSGARELRSRIRYTAHQICTELDASFPGPGGEAQACYRNTIRNAMNEADDVIADARGVAFNDQYEE
jgi:UrcA family protein